MPVSKTKMKNTAIAAKSAALPKMPKELLDQFVSGPMTGEAVNAASMAFKKALAIHRNVPGPVRPPSHHFTCCRRSFKTVLQASFQTVDSSIGFWSGACLFKWNPLEQVKGAAFGQYHPYGSCHLVGQGQVEQLQQCIVTGE